MSDRAAELAEALNASSACFVHGDTYIAAGCGGCRNRLDTILAALPADWCGHDRVIEAYKQAIRDLGSSPDAQANIAVQLLQAEIARLREEALDSDRLGRAMHIRLGHSNKYGGGRCRCWGEAVALAGVYGNLAALEKGDAP